MKNKLILIDRAIQDSSAYTFEKYFSIFISLFRKYCIIILRAKRVFRLIEIPILSRVLKEYLYSLEPRFFVTLFTIFIHIMIDFYGHGVFFGGSED